MKDKRYVPPGVICMDISFGLWLREIPMQITSRGILYLSKAMSLTVLNTTLRNKSSGPSSQVILDTVELQYRFDSNLYQGQLH